MTEPEVHILERHGRLLEKFELRDGLWVSVVDAMSMTAEEAAAKGWVHVTKQAIPSRNRGG